MSESKTKQPSRNTKPDPLFEILDRHLFEFSDPDVDRKAFLLKVVQEYIQLLRKQTMSIPRHLEAALTDELYDHANEMLVKRIYGNLTIESFRKKAKAVRRPRKRAE